MKPELVENSLTRDRFLSDVAEALCVSAEEAARIGDPFDAGLDSVRLLVLAERWRKMGARVGFVELAERRSLDEWWDLVR